MQSTGVYWIAVYEILEEAGLEGMCGLLVAFASISAYAQCVPVNANIRFTNEVIKDGQSAQLVAREGVFYRTENGSTLNHRTRGDLDNARGTGELFDNQFLPLPPTKSSMTPRKWLKLQHHLLTLVSPVTAWKI
jgi:hypothetical protein